MKDHKAIYDNAVQAVKALIADTSVPRSQTKEELENIREEVELWIDDLSGDE